MTTAVPNPVTEPLPTIPLRDVERELSRQIHLLQGPSSPPILKARLSNLVIYCDHSDEAACICDHVPEVIALHPARVLLLIGEPDAPKNELTASVIVRQHTLSGNQQACSEQITLRAGDGAIGHLPFAVRALLIGDIPTNLWWSTSLSPAQGGPLLYGLAETAQQIIYDSNGWSDPVHGVKATAPWLDQISHVPAGQWRIASDLNWRRLKYWLRLVSQTLDADSSPGAAKSVSEVTLEHGPHADLQAWQLVAWMASHFGWRVRSGTRQSTGDTQWSFDGPNGKVHVLVKTTAEGPQEITRLRIACELSGKDVAFSVVPEDGERLAVSLEGVDAAPRTITVPPQSPGNLVARQLNDRERDPVFCTSMAVANAMAEALTR